MELLQKWAEPIHKGISRGIEKLRLSYRHYKGIDQADWSANEMTEYLEKKLARSQSNENLNEA